MQKRDPITVNQAIQILQSIVESDPSRGESLLLVTTSDPSIGPEASTTVDVIMTGFDWEQGQIRIQTTDKIIKKQSPK